MNIFLRILLTGAFLLGSRAAIADTLQLVSGSGQIIAGTEVFPYNFSINGSAKTTALMCLDFNRHITYGELWNVNVTKVPLDNSLASIKYRADAWIYSMLGKYSNPDLQYAVWSIFDPDDINTSAGFTSTAQTLAAQAYKMAQDQNFINGGFFSGFSLYLPNANQAGWTDGMPQDFIGVAVTPEPSSLIMMAIGAALLGCLLAFRSKPLIEHSLGSSV